MYIPSSKNKLRKSFQSAMKRLTFHQLCTCQKENLQVKIHSNLCQRRMLKVSEGLNAMLWSNRLQLFSTYCILTHNASVVSNALLYICIWYRRKIYFSLSRKGYVANEKMPKETLHSTLSTNINMSKEQPCFQNSKTVAIVVNENVSTIKFLTLISNVI